MTKNTNVQTMFQFQNSRLNVFHILNVCIFNSKISAIYPSVYTVCIDLTGYMKHETELYLRNQIGSSFSQCFHNLL